MTTRVNPRQAAAQTPPRTSLSLLLSVRGALLTLCVLFFVAHAACLPTTFADLDSINFALGVRDFDVSRHQPHPPGYPVFIGLAKASTAVVRALGLTSPEVRGLSLLSAMAGVLLIPLLFQLNVGLTGDRRMAAWFAAVTAAAPLFWFNALRPLSDMTGLAIAVLAQVLLTTVIVGRRPGDTARWLMLGALAAGLAIGVRSQNFVLTLPLLGAALVLPGSGLRERERLGALMMCIAGVLLWALPMLVVSGGLEPYLQSLGNQAGEDFSGVVMLWTSRTPRVAADAIGYSFLWPWGNPVAGGVVIAVAMAGAIRMLVRAPWTLGLVCIAFAPYAVFHLLFHETVTTRYALPLLLPTTLLTLYGLGGMGRLAVQTGSVALIIWSLGVTLPAARAYSTMPSPAAHALQDASAAAAGGSVVAMHAVMLRSQQWYAPEVERVIRRLHAREIAGLVDLWRREPRATVIFLADPRRTDLAMLDRQARSLTHTYDWPFPVLPLLGGVRPGAVQLFNLRPPGWMLGEGWAVTAEVGGQTARSGASPLRQPAVAWVRSRPGTARLMIGGRNIGPAPVRVSITAGEKLIRVLDLKPGFFFETPQLDAGTLDSADPYIPLKVSVVAVDGGQTQVDLEQFDVQSDGVPMVGAWTGWHEPELNPRTGRTWRWMSERATLWVRSVGRDVRLRVSLESPLRYFPSQPTLQVSVDGQNVGRLTPAADLTWEITIDSDLLAAANEEVVIQSDSSFVPGDGDHRNLALRVYAITVD